MCSEHNHGQVTFSQQDLVCVVFQDCLVTLVYPRTRSTPWHRTELNNQINCKDSFLKKYSIVVDDHIKCSVFGLAVNAIWQWYDAFPGSWQLHNIWSGSNIELMLYSGLSFVKKYCVQDPIKCTMLYPGCSLKFSLAYFSLNGPCDVWAQCIIMAGPG